MTQVYFANASHLGTIDTAVRASGQHVFTRGTHHPDTSGCIDLEPDVVCPRPATFDAGEVVIGDGWQQIANLLLGGRRRQVLLFVRNLGDVPIEHVRVTRTSEPGGRHWRLRQDVTANTPGQAGGRMPLGVGRTLELTLSNLIGAAEIGVHLLTVGAVVKLTGVAR